MILNNNKLMLIYGFSSEERTLLENIIEEYKLPPYRIIEKNMANMKIRDILDGLKIDTYDKNLPDEKVILFNNFTDSELDSTVRAIRASKSIRPILAVVTATSINWEFHYLIEHLMEEREQARKYMKQKSQN